MVFGGLRCEWMELDVQYMYVYTVNVCDLVFLNAKMVLVLLVMEDGGYKLSANLRRSSKSQVRMGR